MSGLRVIKCSGAGALCGNKLININIQLTAVRSDSRRLETANKVEKKKAKCQVSHSRVITN